jgi:protein ImuB
VLWLCLRFAHLPVELRPREVNMLAVTDRIRSRRVVIAANESARRSGIHAGMEATRALLEEPELRLIDRSKSEEHRALRALADWSLQFSSTVHLEWARWLIWLEIGASLRYFEGLPALRARIEHGIAALHYSATVGIAPTLEAAALFSRDPDTQAAIRREDIESQASRLDLALLSIDNKAIEQLSASGLRTVGEVLAIPSEALARRFGADLTGYLQRLLGKHPDPRKSHRAAESYRRRYEFAEPLQSVEGLLFPLRRVMQEFEGYLRGRDRAIQRVDVTLRHRDSPESSFSLHTSAPLRDASRLFALLREKLERTSWGSPVSEVIVQAAEFHAPEILQGDFFDDSQRQSAGWAALLDKLRARLGDGAVRQLGLKDDHRPEQAWCIVNDSGGLGSPAPYPDRPLWLLEPIAVARPAQLIGRPERIEAGWWSGADTSRDYYLAIGPEGARWWLYKEVGADQWFLHGLWA